MTWQIDQFVGGAAAFDFTNTVNQRPHPRRDTLDRYDGLVDWAIAALLISPEQGAALRQVETRVARRTLRKVLRFRETIYRIFSAIAADRAVDAADIDQLLAVHIDTLAAAALRDESSGLFRVEWSDGDAIVGPLADSALELLRHGPLDKVKECPSCGWLFLDRSRNGTRRWCSMDTCGSREKMRRYRLPRNGVTTSSGR